MDLRALPLMRQAQRSGDVIPPSAPVNLTAAALGSDIILNWSSNAEPDLAGYNIYRKQRSGVVKD